MSSEFRPGTALDPGATAPTQWLLVRGTEILIGIDQNGDRTVPIEIEISSITASLVAHPLGTIGSRNVVAAEVSIDLEPPPDFNFYSFRELFETIDPVSFGLAGRALGVIEWDRTHRFCGRCGAATQLIEGQRSRRCTECGLVRYPRLDPSIIVAVERDGRLLLARNATFTSGFFSVLAGFVDQGETLEEAVHREVREEVGIEIENLAYFGSQYWPFPHGLMVGFTASWAGGELAPDPAEIAEVDWFAPDALPMLPGKISIARELIDDFVRRSREN